MDKELRAQYIVRLYEEGYTLQQLGDAVGLTRERIRQIITKEVGGTKQFRIRPTVCRLEGCERPYDGCRGWCQLHYIRWLRDGSPGPVESNTRPAQHGTRYFFERYGCRCDQCVAGRTAQRLKQKESRLARLHEAPHGTTTAYMNWGCRCDLCKKVFSDYMKAPRQKEYKHRWRRKKRAARR